MTKIQKAFCVFLCLCFFAVLAVAPEPFSRWENMYRQFPLYCFLEKKAKRAAWEGDEKTSRLIVKANGEYLGKMVQEENKSTPTPVPLPTVTPTPEPTPEPTAAAPEEEVTQAAAALIPHPSLDLSPEKLGDFDYLLGNFFVVDENTATNAEQLNAARFLEKDMSLAGDASNPQILIYHSHSQETFADSREGKTEDTVVGVGDYLAELLTDSYGYHVLHVTETFDVIDGEIDRGRAYDFAREYVNRILEENPSIEVVIDLHRDGVDKDRRLITEIDGRPTAQIMFYNGLSYTVNHGTVEYLPNPYIQENLAFSFQLEYQAARYYPTLSRCIYLAGLRYNLDLRPKAILLEAGAQTNTLQEVKNAMLPFADILNRVLKGSDKQG